MNGYLLDTSIALHAGMAESLLSAAIRDALRRGPNYLSVIVYWEITIKSMKGLLDVGEPRSWWEDSLEQLAAKSLVIKPEHITAIHNLPPIHKDPFDRALIAQATVENMILLTRDENILRYGSNGFHAIR